MDRSIFRIYRIVGSIKESTPVVRGVEGGGREACQGRDCLNSKPSLNCAWQSPISAASRSSRSPSAGLRRLACSLRYTVDSTALARALPCSADRRYQRHASTLSCATDSPSSYILPRLSWAISWSASAALVNQCTAAAWSATRSIPSLYPTPSRYCASTCPMFAAEVSHRHFSSRLSCDLSPKSKEARLYCALMFPCSAALRYHSCALMRSLHTFTPS
mmetsp:Transcript_42398/g.113435  ORF Transcript_42398/g.113435 Transcript_42398/m.113435 type:complete len:218 (-) Transcript_42398:352-1005(-)